MNIWLIILLFLEMLTLNIRAQAVSKSLTNSYAKSSFVFKGTVKALNKSLTKDADSLKCAVMTVSQVIKSRDNLAAYTLNHDITVRFDNTTGIKIGDSLLVLSEPNLYGKSISVHANASYTKSSREFKIGDLNNFVASALVSSSNSVIKQEIRNSKIVFSGTLLSIDSLETKDKKYVEHDPNLQLAYFRVVKVLKGFLGDTVSAYYPMSKDVRFFRIPKVDSLIGHEAVFLFDSTDTTSRPNGRFALEVKRRSQVILDKNEVEFIKSTH